jgi:hypothetical protein
MEYQLVLQFATQTDVDSDAFMMLEDDFTERLEDSAEVDGHETIDESYNIFITTASPAKTFDRLRPLLSERSLIAQVTAAYRHVDDDDYKVIWPKEPVRPFLAP